MNIFIDTSVLYKDPFWRSNFYSELLDIVKEREVNLYLSNVVVLEIERNYGKIIDEEIFSAE
jgi:predicted nucleic acid-binding protein